MQVAHRRLIIVAAIALFGASAGIALGNFVAKGPSLTGAQELANYNMMLPDNGAAPVTAMSDRSVPARAGPSQYDCEGCDASPYNDVVGSADSVDLTDPVEPYRSEDAPVVRETPNVATRRTTPASAYLAAPTSPDVSSAPVAVAATQ